MDRWMNSTFWHSDIHPSVHPSIHLDVSLLIHPFIHPSILADISPSIYLSIYLSVSPFIYPLVNPFIHPYTFPSIHPYVRPSLHRTNSIPMDGWIAACSSSFHLSSIPPPFHTSVCSFLPSICPSISLIVHPSNYLTIPPSVCRYVHTSINLSTLPFTHPSTY